VAGQPDLIFQDVTFTYAKGQMVIKGSIKNQDQMQQTVIPMRIALIGAARPEPLTIWVFRPETPYLNPGQVLPFEIIRPFDQGAQVVKLTLTWLAPGGL
jgi:hypothetical protein